MEGALKMARAHGRKIDPQKIELIALENSFHGRTFGALSITGQEKYRRDFEPLLSGVHFVHRNDLTGLEQAVSGRTAAIVFEKLTYDVQCRVADGMLQGELRAQLARGYAMTTGAGVQEIVLKHGYSERLGARPMRDAIERLVRNALSENLLNGGRGVGLLQGHPAGTKLELLPAAPAVAAA